MFYNASVKQKKNILMSNIAFLEVGAKLLEKIEFSL